MQLVRLPQGLTAAQEPQPSAGRVFSAGAPRTVEGVRSRSRSGLMRSSERLNAWLNLYQVGRQLARQRRRALARHRCTVCAALRSPGHEGSDGAPCPQNQAPAA